MPLLYLWHTDTQAAIFQWGNPIQRIGFTVTYSPKQVTNALPPTPTLFLAKTSDPLPPHALLLPNQGGRPQVPCSTRKVLWQQEEPGEQSSLAFFFGDILALCCPSHQ